MAIELANKVILITDKTRIATPIKIALNSLHLEIAADFPALSSIPTMRSGIAKSSKTAFIRKEILRFIKTQGFPNAIIMDSQIDLGPEIYDPEMIKILKTFLIAYVILSKGADCRNLHGNFILLTKDNSFEKKFGIGSNPQGVMNLLTTENPEINYFIDEIKEDSGKFDALFTITLLDTELSSDLITENVKSIISKSPVKSAGKISVPAEKSEPDIKDKGTTSKGEEKETAGRIVYRIDDESVYDDGEILTELTDEHKSLNEKEFYIIGAWSSKTELEVSKKIAAVIQKGINEKARFGYGNAIKFNIDERCIIDKNTTLSMAQLFTKNLAVYKKISITANADNGVLIQKSRGFPMIRKIFTIAGEAGDDTGNKTD